MQSGEEFIKMISAEDYVPDENFYRRIFAQRLFDIRYERGLSRKELAEGAGVSESFIAECERAKRTPKFEHLYKLTSFLGISIDDLVGHTLENSRDVLNYRFDRALELVETSGNGIDFPEDGGCSLIIFADKKARNLGDEANEVVEFANKEAFSMFIETVVEKILIDEKNFDEVVRELMNWWNSKGKENFEIN